MEEGEPVLEEAVRLIAQESKAQTEIAGKGDGLIPRAFELDPVKVKRAMSNFFEVPFVPPQVSAAPELPLRPPKPVPRLPAPCNILFR